MSLTFPLLDAAETAQVRALLAAAPWADGRASAGTQAMRAKNNQQLPLDCEASRAAQAVVFRALNRSTQFLAAALPRTVYLPRFNRYHGATNHFGAHVDGAVRFTESGSRVRTDLSCTVFLCEPGDYDGGELLMHGMAGNQALKLPAGHAVLYPGTSVHEVLPVTRGERLVSFFSVESMVRSNDQRQLLLEVDTALMALRSAAGDHATTVALTGTHHNLLRMRADT